jgi:heme ABC exporter ATP-binding subunit CcmA
MRRGDAETVDSSLPEPMIEVDGLTKAFGYHWALRGITLNVNPGECVSIFGPNGAGKTTLVRILATLSKPTGGRARIAGLTLGPDSADIRRCIGVVSHQTFLYNDLTAEENLRFYARMYGLRHIDRRIHEVIDWVGLRPRLHDPVRTFSRGMQQRLSIVRAMLHDPMVILLDEPHTGLDQHAADALSWLLRGLAEQGRTILMTTHDVERGLEMGGRIAILNQGHIVHEEAHGASDVEKFKETYYRLVGAERQ